MITWFDWFDEAIIWEAIETIDPLKVTARIRPIVIVGWDGDGWLPVHDRAEIIQNGHDTCIVVDPRPDLHRTLARIKADFGVGPWISSSASPGSMSWIGPSIRRCWQRWRIIGQRIGPRCLT
jgi:hypothetical protein